MKITIRKGPVSLELSINPDMLVSELKSLIFESIPIQQTKQVLNCIVAGSIVIGN